jgi:hypothetical protein
MIQRTYSEQLARVRRFFGRLSNENQDAVEFDDDVWSFFQHCWHFKDWLKNDPTLPANITDRVEPDASAKLAIRICADSANRSKHAALTKPNRTDADITSRDTTVLIGGTKESPGTTSISEHTITLGDGSTHWARDIAKQAILDWEEILGSYGLPI